MSLIVTSLLVASGVILGRFLARSRQPTKPDQPEEENEREKQKPVPETKPVAATDPLEGFACKLGDVVMRGSSEEAWLAGAIVLKEQSAVAALFVAPEAKQDRAVLVRPAPNEEILWLSPIDGEVLGVGKEPPASLEHSGDRFERTKRLPVRAVRLGSGAPDVGDTVIFAEYTSLAGDRIVVVTSGKVAAYRGTALESGTYTVLPSGKSTLEED